jgi:hypothetical protein
MSAEPTTPSPSQEVAASAVVAALEAAWTAIRAHHADVPQVVVILGAGSEARRGLFKWGHFAAARWHVAGTNRPEVLVSGEGLRRGPREVLATLLHEAAHGVASTRKLQDTSRQGRWHNRRFATLAGELGLQVTQDPKTGWSQTQLTDQLAGRYADQLTRLGAALRLWRHAELQIGTSTTSRNLLACSCACGRKLRVARSTLEQAPILCGACEEPFEPERQLTRKRQLAGSPDPELGEPSIDAEATADTERNPLLLSAGEVERLRLPITAAMLRLQVDEDARNLPARQRISERLRGVDQRLVRGQLNAERAAARVDVPVRLDGADADQLRGLLGEAATRLEAYARRRGEANPPYMVGPEDFTRLADQLREWGLDLLDRQQQPLPHHEQAIAISFDAPQRQHQPAREAGHER